MAQYILLEERELLLVWLLRLPSGGYAPAFADILVRDVRGEFSGWPELLRAIFKDGTVMLLFVRFVLENKRFVLASRILAYCHHEVCTKMTPREYAMLRACQGQRYDYDEICENDGTLVGEEEFLSAMGRIAGRLLEGDPCDDDTETPA